MKTTPILCALTVPFLQSATAATLTAPGADLNQPSWRTDTVTKSLDADGDNIYGTAGYFLPRFNTGNSSATFTTTNESNGTLYTLPSYFTVTTSGGSTGAGSMYGNKAKIDNPNDVDGPDVASGVTYNNTGRADGYGNLLNFTIGAGLPTGTLRIGILTGTSPDGDRPDGVRLSQTTGTGTDSQAYTIAVGAVQANWYFFDVSGATSGDVFTLSIDSQGPATKPTIGGVTLDVVPEPSGLALFSLGASLMLLRRRRA